ncbi:crocetin glucosyltransferase 3-like [Senna tora]|uniref:Crocetin glucosyltransferase 3-like n=1 Tax=Senna tora TaxID=362788 RepID=A0A834TZ98_9FABA|nr:crocetin glucosyltransferase 3-like [Senna tora]
MTSSSDGSSMSLRVSAPRVYALPLVVPTKPLLYMSICLNLTHRKIDTDEFYVHGFPETIMEPTLALFFLRIQA